jgi:hypothetical protein
MRKIETPAGENGRGFLFSLPLETGRKQQNTEEAGK